MPNIAPLLDTLVPLVGMVPLDVPNPGAGSAPPGSEKFLEMLGWFKWVSLGLLVIALMIAGVRMAVSSRRGDGGEHASSIGWVLGGAILVTGAFTLISFIAR